MKLVWDELYQFTNIWSHSQVGQKTLEWDQGVCVYLCMQGSNYTRQHTKIRLDHCTVSNTCTSIGCIGLQYAMCTHGLTWLQAGGGSLHESGCSSVTTTSTSSPPTAIRRQGGLGRGGRRVERIWEGMGTRRYTDWSALSMCSTLSQPAVQQTGLRGIL